VVATKNVNALYTPIGRPHSGYQLGVFASYPQRSRVYVVRLSCELPYAVGVRKNTAQSITRRQRKQSKKADHIRRSVERFDLSDSVLIKLSLISMPMPIRNTTLQRKKAAGPIPATFFNLLPTLDNLRNFLLTPTNEMLNSLQEIFT